MLLFDWNKIFAKTKGNPKEIFRVIKMLSEGTIPRNRYDKIYKYAKESFEGSSFLAHPDVLIYNSYKHTYRDIGVYVALASLRSVADYIATSNTTLDVFHINETLLEQIPENSLLRIQDDGKLHFRYEEVPSKEIMH